MGPQGEITSLTPDEERRFQTWARSNRITDVDAPESHYDYRGYWKEKGDAPIRFGVDHFTDTYKQHGHPTFSVESRYSNGPIDGGRWEGEHFMAAPPGTSQASQPTSQADPVAAVLRAVKTSDRVRAAAWDIYHQSTDPTDFAGRIKDLPLPDDVKASLFDAKAAEGTRPEMNFATVNGADVPVKDPNTVLTFAKHAGAQLNPITAIQSMGKALIPEAAARAMGATDANASEYGPLNTIQKIGAAQGAVGQKAIDSYKQGDYLTALRHGVNWALPVVGPVIDRSADEFQQGNYAAGAGDAVGLGSALVAPGVLARTGSGARAAGAAAQGSRIAPEVEAANAFAESHGIPLDAGTKLDSGTLRALQRQVGHTLAGEAVSKRFVQGQQGALERVGGELAASVHPSAVTPEQGGQGVRTALRQKAGALRSSANTEYDRLRAMEADPSMQVSVPLDKQPVDLIPDGLRGQLRRIVHEMDASGYTPGKLVDDAPGVASGATYVPRSGGAQVFHDIADRLEGTSTPSRGVVQAQIEEYLAGGKETSAVKAALDVAKERSIGRGGNTVSRPELPPSEMDTPTRLEGSRITSREVGMPVNLSAAKAALRPVYDELIRQMPLTQQQANPGLKALGNILDSGDWAPLSQVDRDLSALKRLARDRGGVAKLGVQHLEDAVQMAIQSGGDEAVSALSKGREAVRARVAVQGTEKVLRGGPLEEPIAAYRQLTAPNDSSLRLLQQVQQQTPEVVPQIGRAHLEDLFSRATSKGGFQGTDRLLADWNRLGPATKAILFPGPGQVRQLDNFFRLAKRIGENPNPSGTAHNALATGQAVMVATNPLLAVKLQLGGYGLAKLLYTPKGVAALTKLLEASPRMPSARIPASMGRTAAVGNVMAVAKELGVEAMPAAADSSRPEHTPAQTSK